SAKELSSHQSYDYKIDLKDGMASSFDKIYNMLRVKLHALKDYLDNMLNKGFIWPLIFTIEALVLFAKKKDSSL
ncbi:hypothetical protein C0993_007764, partial [Termitomyces sp. T159_Od127]